MQRAPLSDAIEDPECCIDNTFGSWKLHVSLMSCFAHSNLEHFGILVCLAVATESLISRLGKGPEPAVDMFHCLFANVRWPLARDGLQPDSNGLQPISYFSYAGSILAVQSISGSRCPLEPSLGSGAPGPARGRAFERPRVRACKGVRMMDWRPANVDS